MDSDRPRPKDWIRRDQLGKWWPQLGGRTAQTLAASKPRRGPPYIIGAGRYAYYQVELVDKWVLEEQERQQRERCEPPPEGEPPEKKGRPQPKPRTPPVTDGRKARRSRMDRYYAAEPTP